MAPLVIFPRSVFFFKKNLRPCLFPRPGDALAGDARHGDASQKSLSAFHRPQYKFRVLLPLRLTEARKTPGVWRDFFVGSLLSVENPIISGPKQALSQIASSAFPSQIIFSKNCVKDYRLLLPSNSNAFQLVPLHASLRLINGSSPVSKPSHGTAMNMKTRGQCKFHILNLTS